VFYDENDIPLVNEHIISQVAKKIGKYVSDFWFESDEQTLSDGIKLPNVLSAKNLKKCTDSWDVWIDSGNSHQAVLKKIITWPGQQICTWKGVISIVDGSNLQCGQV
jgi:isoleucyl-tRNA synthetase